MKKVMIINGSPRKNFNTAKMLKEAARGAEDAGAEVEYVNLYDISYKGCISCLICKRKGVEQQGLCFYKDDLRPLLEKCLNADAVIIGSPVYHSYPSGMMRSFLERFMFPAHTYMIDKENGGLKRVLNRTLPTALIFTMNANEEQFKQHHYDIVLGDNEMSLRAVFGYCETLHRVREFVSKNPTVYMGTHTPLGYENLEAKRVVDLNNPPKTLPVGEITFKTKSGKYVCSVCGYVYDPTEHDGIAFEDLPEDWKCPRCKQPKTKFNAA